MYIIDSTVPGLAKFGIALGLGPRDRGFKSRNPDHQAVFYRKRPQRSPLCGLRCIHKNAEIYNKVSIMVETNEKYGCLVVLDGGEEYLNSEQYRELVAEKETLTNEVKASLTASGGKLSLRDMISIRRLSEVDNGLLTHFKCKCKCGRIHFFNEKTLAKKPKFCYYPVPISDRYPRSTAASDAMTRKLQKYAGIETVILCSKDECIPSKDYCPYYNAFRTKQLEKKERKKEEEIAKIPRKYAKYYDIDFTGRQYESLHIESCINDHFESAPKAIFTQSHRKYWQSITVFKQYKCRCTICGKEQLVTCDKFEINPPTEYGIHAYDGYWSAVSCKCHKISSFQWQVCKVLFEANMPYSVEYSFSDLYGVKGKSPLRFDFAVFDETGAIKCLIECQGEQHYRSVDEFGGDRQYKIQRENDNLKREYCRRNNIQLLEISYKQKKYEIIKRILEENLK